MTEDTKPVFYGHTFPKGPYTDEETFKLARAALAKARKRHNWERVEPKEDVRFRCKNCGLEFEHHLDYATGDVRDSACPTRTPLEELDINGVIARYPSLVAHIICESLGYATPLTAGHIMQDALLHKENWCEWIHACYKCDPRAMLKVCIRNRHHHKGFMADYQHAMALVLRFLHDGKQPLFASWF